MTTLHLRSGAQDDRARSDALFVGDLIVYRRVPALVELAVHVERILERVAGTSEPVDPDVIDGVVTAFRGDEATDLLFALMLREVGVDVDLAYWDRPVLRIVPPDDRPAGAATGTLALHRDTWGSNVRAQTNWWAPLRPVTPDRTIAFHLGRWDRPVPNDSADWDLAEVTEGRRRGADVRLVPTPTEAPDPAGELRLVIAPGDLLCFSGAHLHGSVPNTSDRTRLSIEVRTVHARDLAEGRQAPEVDGAAPHPPAWHWFRRVADGVSLSEVVA